MEGFGNSGVATTDYSYRLVSEEGSITGSTVRYPFTSKFLFSWLASELKTGLVTKYN